MSFTRKHCGERLCFAARGPFEGLKMARDVFAFPLLDLEEIIS